MPQQPLPFDPATAGDRAAALRRWRRVAGFYLAVVAGLWLAARLVPRLLPDAIGWPWPGFWSLLRAVGEAGLVGGLADWFAVTALFRHPLGVPVPHTALVPQNRDRIADGIATYIDSEFLAPDRLRGQVQRLNAADQVAGLLAAPANRAQMADLALASLPRLLSRGREAALREALARAAMEGLRAMDLRPMVARLLRDAMDSPLFEALIQEMSDHGVVLIHGSRPHIRDAVANRSKWWMPRTLDRSLADQVTDALAGHLFDLRSPHSEAGRGLRQWLREIPDRIQEGDPLGDRLASVLRNAVDIRTLRLLAHHLIGRLKTAALEDAANPDGVLRDALDAMLVSLARELEQPATRARLDAAVEGAFLAAIPGWRQAIRSFVTDTLKAQDAADFSRRLEEGVGKDLQFIRINGTVLGALIGAGLYLLDLTFG
ncbi:DUF445 domain-containing protein [Nitrospirillum pindoramense]|uniref:Uncharacterized membrane-anchored protein YjiN (DUF445 family) n=1 Tax=Nitrospirillum amazonense TaxID=28077 RepID=A0A560GM32_9PROT|nr:DUF445 domain-containing protein [Nitrospirillum amazonense]TWB34600.1 uncharacterized membrane-anchored protein YjiN (DUF445 family) [Nitrospirillum amazonense]